MSDNKKMNIEEGVDEVILLDEEGNEVSFDHIMTFFHENERYIALMPLDEVENVEEGEVIILRVIKNGDEDVYESITNEVLLEEVFDTFIELFEEMVEGDDEDDEE